MKRIAFCFLLLLTASALMADGQEYSSWIYSSTPSQANWISTGGVHILGIQLDEAAPNGVIKIWDTAGSTTVFSTYTTHGATVTLLDASSVDAQRYYGEWKVPLSSGFTFNHEGNIKFRIDYKEIRRSP